MEELGEQPREHSGTSNGPVLTDPGVVGPGRPSLVGRVPGGSCRQGGPADTACTSS